MDSKKGMSFWHTLGMKHPLPADERRELLIALLELIRKKHVGGDLAVFPSVAVAQWDLLVFHGAFFFWCKVGPSTPLRILRESTGGIFCIEFAAGKLYETFVRRGLSPNCTRSTVERLFKIYPSEWLTKSFRRCERMVNCSVLATMCTSSPAESIEQGLL